MKKLLVILAFACASAFSMAATTPATGASAPVAKVVKDKKVAHKAAKPAVKASAAK